jgi:glyoxylate/hydroxypyruvate reductase A
MMAKYVVMHVLRLHRDMPGYQAAQTNPEWRRTTIVRPELDPKAAVRYHQ